MEFYDFTRTIQLGSKRELLRCADGCQIKQGTIRDEIRELEGKLAQQQQFEVALRSKADTK